MGHIKRTVPSYNTVRLEQGAPSNAVVECEGWDCGSVSLCMFLYTRRGYVQAGPLDSPSFELRCQYQAGAAKLPQLPLGPSAQHETEQSTKNVSGPTVCGVDPRAVLHTQHTHAPYTHTHAHTHTHTHTHNSKARPTPCVSLIAPPRKTLD